MGAYIALIHKDPDSEYGVSFPDFPGCISAGTNLEEARLMAQEALELHVQGMIEDGEEMPAPSSLDEIRGNPDYTDALAYVAIAGPTAAPTVDVNISLPAALLESVDKRAASSGCTRAGFIAEAVKQAVAAD